MLRRRTGRTEEWWEGRGVGVKDEVEEEVDAEKGAVRMGTLGMKAGRFMAGMSGNAGRGMTKRNG